MNAGQVADAVMDVARTAPRRFTIDDVAKIDELVVGYPLRDQLALARNMLRAPEVHASPIARGPLATIRRAIAPIQTQDVGGATVLKQVRDNIDTEINRIDGVIPSNGYDGHPDYAAVGSVRDGLDLLERLGAFTSL